MDYTGTAGNDNITGTEFADIFDMSQGGEDTVNGEGGSDEFDFGATFDAGDRVNGGTGPFDNYTTINKIVLDGDYSSGLTLGAHTIKNIQVIQFDSGHSYKLTTNDGNVATGQTLYIDGSQLTTNDRLVFSGAHETDGNFEITGGAGNDTLTGGHGDDGFDIAYGGEDTVRGGAGNDAIDAYGAFDAGDRINGGPGKDTLNLTSGDPDFLSITLGPKTLTNVEKIEVSNAKIITNDATVAAGKTLTVDAGNFDHGKLVFDGSAETNGHFNIIGSAENDVLTGGKQSDTFNLIDGGNDTVSGRGGNDIFQFGSRQEAINGAPFTAKDHIDGGGGTDTVTLNCELSGQGALTFGPKTMLNVEILQLWGGGHKAGRYYNYDLTTNDATVANGKTLTVDASPLTMHSSLTFNGSAETDGHFVFLSGGGQDDLTGGAQSDTFVYNDGINLSGATRDDIHSFDFANDVVKFAGVTGIDAAVTTGAASNATIDSDLSGLFGAGQADELGAHHAVLFTPDGGDLAGKTLLIVDGDGIAGYTSGSDLVIQLSDPIHTADISAANFTA